MLLSFSYMYAFVPCVYLVPMEVRRVGTGVTVSLSHYVDVGNQAEQQVLLVLCTSRMCSQPPNHFSSIAVLLFWF